MSTVVKPNTKKRALSRVSAIPSEFKAKKLRASEKEGIDSPRKAERDKRRSRPVTVPSPLVSDESASDDEGTCDIFSRRLDDSDTCADEEDCPEYADDDFLGNGTDDTDEDMEKESIAEVFPQSSKKELSTTCESHKAQKILTQQRRASKPHSSLLTEAKRIWSLARQKGNNNNVPRSERQKHVAELMRVIRGHVKEIVVKHDASRIVQTLLKYGSKKERDEVATELKGQYKDLIQNKYSKFLVVKLMRFCPEHRASILMEFQNHVLKLLMHREATSVLADTFELYANAYERSILLRDFYGKEATLFSVTNGSGLDKEWARKGFKGFLDGADGERKNRLLKSLKENLVSIYNNPDKGAFTHAIVHRALWEYIHALSDFPDVAQREKLQREIFETCQESLAEMVHTKDGSRVVREFLALGSAKDRKQILKVLKPHIERMCSDNEAQLVLFTALDVIDDTKLLFKSLITEITGAATKLYTSSQGRRALLYLLVPRMKRHFTPAQIALLAETDGMRACTSKKDADLRENEIRKFASESLISWVEQNASSLVREPGSSLLVADIMLFSDGDKSAVIQSLLRQISSGYPTDPSMDLHPIDLPHSSRMFKILLQGGHFSHTNKAIKRVHGWDAGQFAIQFTRIVGENVSVAMCTRGEGNGAFVIAELCEALVREAGNEVERQTVKSWFGDRVRRAVAEGPAKGKKVLLEKLATL